MATHIRMMRRGLPRRHGGDLWPPEGAAPTLMPEDATMVALTGPVATDVGGVLNESETTATAMRYVTRSGRRGLPRVRGGDAWPPASETPAVVNSAPGGRIRVGEEAATDLGSDSLTTETPLTTASPVLLPGIVRNRAPVTMHQMRRGLPRVPGGDRWPTQTDVLAQLARGSAAPNDSSLLPEREESSRAPLEEKGEAPRPAGPSSPAHSAQATAAAEKREGSDLRPVTASEIDTPGRSRAAAWVIGGIGLFIAAVSEVFFTRWFVTLGFMRDFLVTYPGETHLPANAEPGFPAWVQWQHFFNVFLVVLIIRTGLQVRVEKRPAAFWTPRWSKGENGKISLNLWLHQSLDVLWLLNGVVFVVMLFVTGHWMRLVPTTWEVFPNALSALIQYISLDWPTENGWVNYNSLQMLMYFLTVFIAAPLAAITGVRMSGVWPKDAKALNRFYPVEWARAIHLPVMLYFVSFIVVHVALVFATGALRNLNHMYGDQDAVNWAGFWIFLASVAVIVGVWIVARPLVLAPIAALFGRVSSR